MSWLSTLLSRRRPEEQLELVELRTVRLRQVVRCYGDFLDCVEDAAEKQSGDYILDRQYVISLAGRAFDLTDSILFDAEIIAGRYLSELSARAAALRASVHETLSHPLEGVAPALSEEAEEEPEYRLLRELRRMLFQLTNPPKTPDRACGYASLLDIVHSAQAEASGAVAQLLAGSTGGRAEAREVDGGPAVRLLVADLGGALANRDKGKSGPRAAEVSSEPLAAFLAGVANPPSGTPVVVHAAATHEHAFLTSSSSAGTIVVDALLSVDDRLDHLYAHYRPAGVDRGPDPAVAGLTAIRADGATTFWRHRLPQGRMRGLLAAFGRLAAGAEWQVPGPLQESTTRPEAHESEA